MHVHICLCTCWFGWAVAGVWRSGIFQESVLSFYCVGLKIKLRSSGLVTGTFCHWSILLVVSILTFKFLPTHAAQVPLHYKLGAINCRHFFLRVLEAGIPRPKCWQGTITITFCIYLFCMCVNSIHMWSSEDNLCDLVFSFHQVGLHSDCWTWYQVPLPTVHRHACVQVCFILKSHFLAFRWLLSVCSYDLCV